MEGGGYEGEKGKQLISTIWHGIDRERSDESRETAQVRNTTNIVRIQGHNSCVTCVNRQKQYNELNTSNK